MVRGDTRRRVKTQAPASAVKRPLFSPAEGMVSHDHAGKAYTRLRSGAIVRVPDQDHRGAFVRSLRGARDRMTTVRERRQ